MSGESMSTILSLLNDHHRRHVIAYLKYFRNKRLQHLEDVGHCFDDVQELRLLDDVYTKDDVLDIITGLRKVVCSNLNGELENFSHTNVLNVRQLLLEAEAHNVTLNMDLSCLDNELLLADIDKLDNANDLPYRSTSLNPLNHHQSKSNRLDSIGGPSKIDMNLFMRVKEFEITEKQLRERLDAVQKRCQEVLRENANLREQSRHAQDTNVQMQNDDSIKTQLERQLNNTKQMLLESEMELKDRINKTHQFKELQKLLRLRNEQVKSLKLKVMQYEPEFVLE